MNKFGLKGVFDIIKYDKDGNVIENYHFENLILNQGLDLVGNKPNNQDYLEYGFVGTGNSEPNVQQTELDNQLAYAKFSNSSNQKTTADDETYKTYTRRYRFTENMANGNISEIGVGVTGSNNKGVLFCRTLIKDGQNRPTVISKLQGEILEVIYTLKVNFPMTDKIETVQIGDKQYRMTARISRMNNNTYYQSYLYDGNINGINNEPSGRHQTLSRQFTHHDNVNDTYKNGDYKIGMVMTASIDTANYDTGVRSVMVRGLFDMWWQCQFDAVDDGTAIPKNNTQKLTLIFNQSWGRV